jgi:hypothetical protein
MRVVVVVRERAVTKERLGVSAAWWYQAVSAFLQESNKRSREERGKNDGQRMKRQMPSNLGGQRFCCQT